MPAYGVTLGTLPPAAALLSTAVAEGVAGVGLGQAGPSATVGGRALLPEEGVLGAPGLSVGDVGQSTGGLSQSPSMSPIPHRIVSKARSGQFVDMRDFLSDNVALLQQLEAFGVQSTGPAFPGAPRPRLRDVPLCHPGYTASGVHGCLYWGCSHKEHACICLLDH